MSKLYNLHQLDKKLSNNNVSIPSMPRNGWLKSIRSTLGMTHKQLAKKLSVSGRRIATIEEAEKDGKLKLDTLQKVANALGCDLKYVLIPKHNTSLYEQAYKKAKMKALKMLNISGQHMSLENQLADTEIEEQTKILAEEMLLNNLKSVWDDD